MREVVDERSEFSTDTAADREAEEMKKRIVVTVVIAEGNDNNLMAVLILYERSCEGGDIQTGRMRE